MPASDALRISLPGRVRIGAHPVQPVAGPIHVPPQLPEHLSQSTVMLSSLPSIATNVDGITRQFYNSNLPIRRLILPS